MKVRDIIFFAGKTHNEVQRYISIFMSQREIDRERQRESKSESKSESECGNGKGTGKGKGQGKGKGKRERESTKALAILFLNRLGQSEKSANYSILYCTGKSSIVCTVNNP